MLARRLVAGPSSALFLRRLASTAVAETDTPSPSTPLSTPSHHRLRHRSHARERLSGLTTSPAQQERLVNIISSNKSPDAAARNEIWTIFRSLNTQQRSTLSVNDLKVILRAVVPRSEERWAIKNGTDRRNLFSDNRKLSLQWETRLRAVMSDLVVRNQADFTDWLFVLQALSAVGHVSACESIIPDMPEKYRNHRQVSELRLNAIIRWLSNLNGTGCAPRTADVDLASNALWLVFHGIQQKDVVLRDLTLRLLLSSASQLYTVVSALGNRESLTRLDDFFTFVLLEGYGIDLNNIASSVEARKHDSTRRYASLSSRGLNAVLEHMSRRGADSYAILAAFELLIANPTYRSSKGAKEMYLEDEDEEDFVPTLSGMTSAESHGDDRRSWFGSSAETTSSSFFGSTTPVNEQQLEVLQSQRYVRDYIPSPSSPRAIAPYDGDLNSILGGSQGYDQDTIRILLTSIRKSGNLRLFHHALQAAVSQVTKSRAEWMSHYLACPAEKRIHLRAPVRIQPEWFRIGSAFNNHQGSSTQTSLMPTIEIALKWVEEEIDVIIGHEKLLGISPSTVSSSEGERVSLPLPDFATDMGRRRQLRSEGIFIVSDALEQLYADRIKLQELYAHASHIADNRERRKLAANARRAARAAEAATQAQVAAEAESPVQS